MENTFLVQIRNIVEGFIKFPNLKSGETSIQIGFDLSSKNLVTDVIVMLRRVGKKGRVIAIDPDISNHNKLKPLTDQKGFKVLYVNKGTYKEKSSIKLEKAKRASENKLITIQGEIEDKKKTNEFVEVEVDTLDNILSDLNVSNQSVSAIHITNNGAEYATLLGMDKLLKTAKNLSLHIRCGRAGDIGIIDGKNDNELIKELLVKYGFETKFYNVRDLFYWGFISKFLIKGQKDYFNKEKTQGVVIATKGSKKMKWFQSYA